MSQPVLKTVPSSHVQFSLYNPTANLIIRLEIVQLYPPLLYDPLPRYLCTCFSLGCVLLPSLGILPSLCEISKNPVHFSIILTDLSRFSLQKNLICSRNNNQDQTVKNNNNHNTCTHLFLDNRPWKNPGGKTSAADLRVSIIMQENIEISYNGKLASANS
jgi:hypothetical protein